MQTSTQNVIAAIEEAAGMGLSLASTAFPGAGPAVELATVLLGAAEKVALPAIQRAFAGGEITAEQQAAILQQYQTLRDNFEAAFSGPEWQIPPAATGGEQG